MNGLAATAIAIGFGGDASKWKDVSYKQVSHDLSGVYRIFIKMLSPGFVVSRAGLVWKQYFRDNGTMRAVLGKNEVDVFLDGAQSVPPWILNGHCGSVLAALEATRIKRAIVEITESGQTHARWHARWS